MKYKQKRGLYQGYVDLHLSGDYLKNFITEVTPTELIITGSEYKADGFGLGEHLISRYGADIEEFNEKSLDIIYAIIGEELANEIKKYLQII